MKRIRLDILAVLLVPFVFAIIIQAISGTFNLISVYSLLLALILECIFLNDSKKDISTGKDKGLISGFLTSMTLSTLQFVAANIHGEEPYKWLIISILLICVGITFRLVAKLQLKDAFSHSLRIKNDHQLITSGLYKYIRHPSYTGTIFLITGVALNINILTTILMLSFSILLVCYRINIEEKMMINFFGEDYVKYSKHTKKIFPFIF